MRVFAVVTLRGFRCGLVAAVLVFGFVIAVRVVVGPIRAPVRVRAPIPAEGWFGLAFVLLLLSSGSGGPRPRVRRTPRVTALCMALIVLPTLPAFRRGLRLSFLSDDFVHVKIANSLHRSWGPLFTSAGGDRYFRPIGYVSLALDAAWDGVRPERWHLSALALHCANVALVFLLALRILSSLAPACFAALLFAVHGARPEAVVWVAARFDLLATFFVLAGLLLFLGGRRWRIVSFACMVLAILSKESAYVFPLLLLLFPVRRARAIIPFFAGAAALFLYRWHLVGGIGGYRDARTGAPEIFSLGLVSVLKVLALRIWAVLLFPINWSVEPDRWLAAATVAYVAVLVWLVWRRASGPWLVACGFVLAPALPPLSQLLIGSDLQKARLLYLPSVGFCLMLAIATRDLRPRGRWLASGVIVLFQWLALQHNLGPWEQAAAKADRACAVAARCGGLAVLPRLPRTLRGVYFFANGFRECVEMHGDGGDKRTGSLVWDPVREELVCLCVPLRD